MASRYLFGPVTRAFAEQNLNAEREAGHCVAFDAGDSDLVIGPADAWESVVSRLPADWRPDFIVLQLYYAAIPECLWSAPVPVIVLAGDANLLWHYYRRQLPAADFILTDPTTVERLACERIQHAQSANLFGCERAMLEAAAEKKARDIDILFVGNLHPAVQRERLPWLARLARMSDRWNVVIRQGTFGADYRELLARSRIVFNRSVRGECNKRAIEATVAGALLVQECNLEMPDYFEEGKDYIAYTADNLETLLDYYLEHEDERRAIAEQAQEKARQYSFEELWERQLRVIEQGWPVILDRAQQRGRLAGPERLNIRVWQALGGAAAGDPALEADLAAAVAAQPGAAWLHNALGIVSALKAHQAGENGGSVAAKALPHFQRAVSVDPLHVVAGVNLVETCTALHKDAEAIEQARKTLALLSRQQAWDRSLLDAGHFPPLYDFFRVAWEEAAWTHPGDVQAETEAKRRLLRWRLHGILGELTGDINHFYESVLARPDMPTSRAALGCALGRNRQAQDAVKHLEQAVEANPLDLNAARALYQALGDVGDEAGQRRLARARRLFARAAPQVIPPEPWFAEEPVACARSGLQPDGADCQSALRDTEPLKISWQGDQLALHSLAYVNRELCTRLLERGHKVAFEPAQYPAPESEEVVCSALLRERLAKPLGQAADVHVSLQWPPQLTPPRAGHWVIIQPWEFGSLPKAWVAPLRDLVDEIWVPSRFVRSAFMQSGIPADRVQVVPLGVDPARFQPAAPPYPLPTNKKFKFLFVGGTIHRKGIDILLESYTQTFSRDDDVCLVIKDMGVGAFYKGQTAEARIAECQARGNAPEIVYLNESLREQNLAGLYTACDCLVHPYRGEGFGLPILEAMACGLPVMVTGFGAALDFCNDDNAFLVPAKVVHFSEKRLGDLETVDYPFLAELDQAALRSLLRYVMDFPDRARRKADAARAYVTRHLTWDQSASLALTRLQAITATPVRRESLQAGRSDGPILYAGPRERARHFSLSMIVKNEEANLPACLESVQGLFDEIVIVDTGSTDRTKEIARRLGARVYDFPWVDHFAAARNESLSHVTGDWVFWMDADDRLDPVNRQKLAGLFDQVRDENVAYVMQCLCVPDGPGDPGTLVHHVRLFQNRPELRWKYRVHEQILPAVRAIGGATRFTDIVIQHTGYLDAAMLARKQERDRRLLLLENQEQPNEPFVLFNLSQVYLKMKQPRAALPLLEQSLKLSAPSDSIVRKLYFLIVQAYRQLGDREQALAVCRKGLAVCPNDAELLSQDAQLRLEQGDEAGAETCYLELLGSKEAPHFASVPAGLRGFQTRHNLAMLYKKQGRLGEAEAQWRLAMEEQPMFQPALLGLEDIYAMQKHWDGLELVARSMERLPHGNIEAAVTRARAHMERREFAHARCLLEQAIVKASQALRPRVLLSFVLLQEGRDLAAAESALRDVLRLDPENPDARRNLSVLLQHMGRVA